MRFAPDRRHFVCERGQHPSDGPRRLEVRDAQTGAVLATMAAGHNPRWLGPGHIMAEAADTSPSFDQLDDLVVQYIPANRGQLDACHDAWAVSDLSETVLHDGAMTLPVAWARDPRLSASRHLAVRHPSTGEIGVVGVTGHIGPCEDSRWGSDTLVWWLGGRVWGRTTPDQPTVELTIPGRAGSHPAPVWHAKDGRLYVALVLDAGELVVCEWGSLTRRESQGWRIGTSDGSGFDWDVVEDGPGRLRVAYFDSLGVPVLATVDVSQPAVSLAPPPDPDRWTLVPDGTLVTDAIQTLVGTDPVRRGDIICLHKNTFPECEWRRVVHDPMRDILLHWADASRFPGDRGWWIEPAPMWAQDVFASGDALRTENATLVDFHHGTTNRWRQTNTLYGIVDGGVMIRFDPRFPGQYTDMTTQGTPQWAPAGYEKQWTRHDGWAKWQYIVTPLTAKGVIPWGDPSMDIVIQTVETGPQPARDPLPFVPCPRPLHTPPPPEDEMTTDEAAALAGYPVPSHIAQGALNVFRANLLARDQIAPDTMTAGAFRYFFQHYCPSMAQQQVRGGIPGNDQGWGHYSVTAVHGAMAAYNRDQKPHEPVEPGTFSGPIGTDGDQFTVPS